MSLLSNNNTHYVFLKSSGNLGIGTGSPTRKLHVSGSGAIANSRQIFTSGYPKTNDTGDADNTGDGTDVVSYAVNYSAASWNDNDIEQGVIHDNASPVSSTKLLCSFSFTSFAKTASDTLKIFVNHAFENQ